MCALHDFQSKTLRRQVTLNFLDFPKFLNYFMNIFRLVILEEIIWKFLFLEALELIHCTDLCRSEFLFLRTKKRNRFPKPVNHVLWSGGWTGAMYLPNDY